MPRSDDARQNPVPATEGVRVPGIAHNMAYSVAGQVGYVLSQLLVLSALAQFQGQEAVGQFGLALAVTTPLFMLANMGVRTSQASDVGKIYAFAEYAGLVLALAILAMLASIGIGYAILGSGQAFLIVLVVSFMKLSEAVSNASYGAYQQAGRMDKVARSLWIRGLLSATAFTALLWLGAETGVAFLAQLVVWSVVAVAFDYPRACQLSAGRWVWPILHRRSLQLLRETVPIGGGHFLNALLVSMPRFFVNEFLGLGAVGLFVVVGYFQQAATLVINAVSQALVNGFARQRHGGGAGSLRRTALALLAIASILSLLGLTLVHFFGEWLLGALFGAEFRAASPVLMLIALAVSVKLFCVVPQGIMHADRRFKAYFWYQASSVAVSIVSLSIAVPHWGLIGAGVSVLLVAAFRLAVLTAACWLGRAKGGAAVSGTAANPAMKTT